VLEDDGIGYLYDLEYILIKTGAAETSLMGSMWVLNEATGVSDDGSRIVEAFRNCPCGSTLMDFFTDRRDMSEKGLRRRERFGELLDYLVENGMERAAARAELLKVLKGGSSAVLANFSPPPART